MNGQFRTNFLHSALTCPLCGDTRTRARFFLPGGGVLYRCRHCTVEFISPQPDEAQLKKLYSESYYTAWGLSGEQDNESTRSMKRASFRLRLSLLSRFLPPDQQPQALAGSAHAPVSAASPQGADSAHAPAPAVSPQGAVTQSDRGRPTILDVGCATGYFLELAREQGFEPFGVEYSAYAAARARLLLGADAIFQGVLEHSSFQKGSFTAIAMSDLLEHVPVPASTLEFAGSLLKQDGVILIMTPDTGALSRKLMGQRWTHYKPEHLFYFNHRSLTWLASRCGLSAAHFERSKKALNLAYLHTQFSVYRHWLLTPMVALLYRLAPVSLRTRNFHISIGEMVIVLKKRP